MLLPQINIKLRCNNQITLTQGNYRARANEVGKGVQYYHDKIDKRKLSAAVNAQKADTVGYRSLAESRKALPLPPLDIIKKSQRSKKNPRLKQHKPKSFSRFAGQRLRESGAAMSIACKGNHQKCREVTLTLPANHSKAFEAIARESDYAINRLFQPIRREWGKEALWFFVWEYQKRGALHIHVAIYNQDEKECKRMAEKLIAQWHEVLLSIGERQGVCMFSQKRMDRCTIRQNHQNHTAPIEKDVACYFAKYAGKTESKQEWYCQKYPVSRFWGSSRSIKKIVRENSLEFTWDMLGGELVYDKKFEEIIESIIGKLNIVSTSQYQFDVTLNGKHRLNRYQNGKKVIAFDADRTIANGTRYTFYTDAMDYQKAITLTKELSRYF